VSINGCPSDSRLIGDTHHRRSRWPDGAVKFDGRFDDLESGVVDVFRASMHPIWPLRLVAVIA
jgi:hypothetical protein